MKNSIHKEEIVILQGILFWKILINNLFVIDYLIITPGLFTTGILMMFDSTMLSGRKINFLS